MKQKHGIPFQCEKCDEVFREETMYKHHIANNHPAFVYTICGVAKFQKSKCEYRMDSISKHFIDAVSALDYKCINLLFLTSQ